MKKSPIIFFIILVILTISLIWLIYYQEYKSRQVEIISNEQNEQLVDLEAQQRQVELTKNYQENLKQVFENFLAQNNLLADADKTNQSLQQLEKDILDLIVPATYKDLHLNLIIAINKLKTFDSEEIKQSRLILNEQVDFYQWLSPFLTLFIINYY